MYLRYLIPTCTVVIAVPTNTVDAYSRARVCGRASGLGKDRARKKSG